MKAPFADFIKALVQLREQSRPTQISNLRTLVVAARHLHDVSAESDYDPCLLLPRHFDAASKSVRSRATPETAYGLGRSLAEIARCLDDHGIGRVPIRWTNSIPRPGNHDRIGPKPTLAAPKECRRKRRSTRCRRSPTSSATTQTSCAWADHRTARLRRVAHHRTPDDPRQLRGRGTGIREWSAGSRFRRQTGAPPWNPLFAGKGFGPA